MSAETDVTRRVTLVENEILHVYDLVDERTAALQAQLDQHSATLNRHSALHDQHTARFDQIDETLAEVLRRLPAPPTA